MDEIISLYLLGALCSFILGFIVCFVAFKYLANRRLAFEFNQTYLQECLSSVLRRAFWAGFYSEKIDRTDNVLNERVAGWVDEIESKLQNPQE